MDLQQRIEQIARAAKGRVGVSALVLETNASITLRGNEKFPMQSVYKLPISMAVLHQVDQKRLSLTQKVAVSKRDFVRLGQHSPIRDAHPNGVSLTLADIVRYNVSESDGTACDVLLRLVGGPRVVTDYLHSIGVNNIVVANTEKELGSDETIQYKNWASPRAATNLLRTLHIQRPLSPSSHTFLQRLMVESPTGPRRIKGLLPKGTVVAHKTGSSGTRNGFTPATNDIGLIILGHGHHLALAVFVSDSKADTPTRERVIAQIARAAWDTWNK